MNNKCIPSCVCVEVPPSSVFVEVPPSCVCEEVSLLNVSVSWLSFVSVSFWEYTRWRTRATHTETHGILELLLLAVHVYVARHDKTCINNIQLYSIVINNVCYLFVYIFLLLDWRSYLRFTCCHDLVLINCHFNAIIPSLYTDTN